MSPLSPSKVDIGMGCRFLQSSFLEPGHEADYLMPSTLPGGFFFSTNLEDRPWAIVDLGCRRVFSEITLWNREDVGSIVVERASPLLIETSEDTKNWRVIAHTTQFFGGRRSARPLSLGFPLGQAARYIRVTVEKLTHFHLDYIEITQHVPQLDFGQAVNLVRDNSGVVSCEYIHYANNGLYSGYSTALHDIIKLSKSEIAVRRIDLSMSFSYFKDRTNLDAYPLFFDKPVDTFLDLCRGVDFHCEHVHLHYRELQLDALHRIVKRALSPASSIESKALALLQATKIDPNTTIAVIYRGTDKSTELTLASITDYIETTKCIRYQYPSHKILIQTDQEQARSAFIEAFGSDCSYFASLPVTQNATAIHLQLADVSSSTRQSFAEDVMAAVQAVSRCDVILTHTGNVGAWIAIYRGHADRLYQFDANGRLVLPPAEVAQT